MRPSYYTDLDVEPISVIEAWNLPFALGCVVKYIARYRRKGGIEDLRKAAWYLAYELDKWESRTGEAICTDGNGETSE